MQSLRYYFLHYLLGSINWVSGKIFRYSQQAIDHEYKDRGLAPYVCKHCPFKSADNWALAKHKKVCPGAPAQQPSSVMPALNLTL